MLLVPDSSVFIPYVAGRAYQDRINTAIRTERLVLCSVVAEEIMAGARDQRERQRYDALFARFQRLGQILTPDDGTWRSCGRLISRYRQRYGAIEPRDHQNDVLIVLATQKLAQESPTTLLTENDADLVTWHVLSKSRSPLRIEALRRTPTT